MEFRVLGPLEVIQDGRAVPVRGSRRRLLLATLLVHRNLVVTVDRLVDVLFADDPPDRAVSTRAELRVPAPARSGRQRGSVATPDPVATCWSSTPTTSTPSGSSSG